MLIDIEKKRTILLLKGMCLNIQIAYLKFHLNSENKELLNIYNRCVEDNKRYDLELLNYN
jgi:hypothetical protein